MFACGDSSRVGEGIELDKIKNEGGDNRLGVASPTPPPAESPAAAPQEQPKQAAPKPNEAPPYEVTLITNSPYFHPGQVIRVPVGTKVRITNKDESKRHPFVEGLFDAGTLAPGAQFVYEANTKTAGQAQIKDQIATFKVGFLEVY